LLFDPIKDFTADAFAATSSNIRVMHPSVSVRRWSGSSRGRLRVRAEHAGALRRVHPGEIAKWGNVVKAL
jgi:hypothetical protein